MRKFFTICIIAAAFSSCGGNSTDGTKLGKDICDCFKKANAMSATDPKFGEAQQDCIKKQGEAYFKVKDKKEELDKFNKAVADCQ